MKVKIINFPHSSTCGTDSFLLLCSVELRMFVREGVTDKVVWPVLTHNASTFLEILRQILENRVHGIPSSGVSSNAGPPK